MVDLCTINGGYDEISLAPQLTELLVLVSKNVLFQPPDIYVCLVIET